jgi:hypothetical protein
VNIRFEFAEPFVLARLVLHPGNMLWTYGFSYQRHTLCPRRLALSFDDAPESAALQIDTGGRWEHRTPFKVDVFRGGVERHAAHPADVRQDGQGERRVRGGGGPGGRGVRGGGAARARRRGLRVRRPRHHCW